MPKVIIQVDSSACISAANCVGVAPQFFQIGMEPHVELIDREGSPIGVVHSFEATAEELELLVEAAESCPTRAIAVKTGT